MRFEQDPEIAVAASNGKVLIAVYIKEIKMAKHF